MCRQRFDGWKISRSQYIHHLVAEATERRRLRKSEKGHGDNEKGDHAEEQEDFNSLMCLGPFFRLIEEIDPEVLDKTMKVL